MMKSRLIWLLWLAGIAAAAVFTGEYLYMVLLLIFCVALVMSGLFLIGTPLTPVSENASVPAVQVLSGNAVSGFDFFIQPGTQMIVNTGLSVCIIAFQFIKIIEYIVK